MCGVVGVISSPERIDVHNVSVDGELAAAGLCGMTHLPTGRVCVRPARHLGSCDFVAPEAARAELRGDAAARRQSAPTW
jgi:hypothetical protein